MSEQRAALVDEINTIIEHALFHGRQSAAGDHIIAAVEAAGWGPRPEAVTADDIYRILYDTPLPVGMTDGARTVMVRDVLSHPVLRSRGITVEGAK